MHIDGDAFFASVERSFNPLLSGKPVIVGGEADQRACVHTASYEARALGVKTGMPIQAARKLCPDAVCIKGDFRKYKAATEVMRNILYTVTPYVEVSSLDDMYIDVTGYEAFFDSLYDTALYIKSEIYRNLRITVSVGAASSKLVARVASSRNKPDGITIVPPERESEFIADLPVNELPGIGRVYEKMLYSLGVKTIGECARLPKNVLIQLFGVNGKKIWEFANCIDNRLVRIKGISKQISRETSFEEDTDDEKIIKGTLSYLTERIASKLRENKWVCKNVRLKILFSNYASCVHSSALSSVTDDSGVIYDSVMKLYQRMPERRVRVRLVSIAVSKICNKYNQTLLFCDTSKKEKLNKKLDDIRFRFGFTSLCAANTLSLKTKYRMEKHGYILHAPSLSQ